MLTTAEKKHLKAQAHALKPVVTIGAAGLTDTVLAEIERALDHHELIKIKLPALEREERSALAEAIADATRADMVQSIGRIGVFFRKNPEQNAKSRDKKPPQPRKTAKNESTTERGHRSGSESRQARTRGTKTFKARQKETSKRTATRI